jgi:hypothetical protein
MFGIDANHGFVGVPGARAWYGQAGPMSPPATTEPRIWLVIGEKAGDNAQAETVAEALARPYQRRVLHFLPGYEQGKPRYRASVHHVDRTRSDPLEPPWPDLVITIGRRPSMAALWIRAQSEGRTRLVIIGRPRRYSDRFDLIVAPGQYRVPALSNLLRLDLPLMRSDPAALDLAASQWAERFRDLPRPLTAVLIGGPTQPHRFDSAVADELLRRCHELQRRSGGTLYLSTSRRTPPEVVATLEAGLPPGAMLYRWDARRRDTPYLGLLALADRFVVTGDSISMMVEVARNRGALAIFPLPSHAVGRLWQRVTAALFPDRIDSRARRLASRIGRWLYRTGLTGYPRDLTRVHRFLIEYGHAVELGDAFRCPEQAPPDGLDRVVSRIDRLLERPREPGVESGPNRVD